MDEKIIGVVSGTRNGVPLILTTPSRCDDPAVGELYLGVVSGTRNGRPLVIVSSQVCVDGTLSVGKGYLGLLSGTRNGLPLLLVPCGGCEEPLCCQELINPGVFGLYATITVAGMPGSPFTINLNVLDIPGGENCYRHYEGNVGVIVGGGASYTASAYLVCLPACGLWKFKLDIQYVAAGPVFYRIYGDVDMTLASMSPVVFDTVNTTAIAANTNPVSGSCCTETDVTPPPFGEWRCEVWSHYANLVGAAVTIDITE